MQQNTYPTATLDLTPSPLCSRSTPQSFIDWRWQKLPAQSALLRYNLVPASNKDASPGLPRGSETLFQFVANECTQELDPHKTLAIESHPELAIIL